MKNQKILAVMCCITLGVGMVMTGCGTTNTSSGTDTTTTTKAASTTDGTETEDAAETNIYGQITAIDGDTITIALAEETGMKSGEDMDSTEMPEKPADGEAANSTEMPEKPADGEMANSTEMPEGVDSTEMPEGVDSTEMGMPGDNNKMEATLTGEEQTITIDANTVITVSDKEATITDLAVDNMVMVVMNGDTVTSITVPGGMGAGQGDGEMPSTEAKTSTEVSTEE